MNVELYISWAPMERKEFGKTLIIWAKFKPLPLLLVQSPQNAGSEDLLRIVELLMSLFHILALIWVMEGSSYQRVTP